MKQKPSPHYSDAKSWTERWTLVRSLESGNQGLALEATDASGARAFVKVLQKLRHKERRARFAREVRVLGDLDVPGIPRLIESNVGHVADKSVELYLAAEFIDGRHLRDVVADGIDAAAAVEMTRKIARIVKAAHLADVLHRDVKPENVVVRDDDGVLTPFLVDFGMAHVDESPGGFATNDAQEVGNRFLRLPEFGAGFENKNDPRSDYTFCVGLLYFMLTKSNPIALLDESNNPPHLRRVERILLRESGLEEDRLLRFFDIGFQNDIAKRFQTADDLIAGLDGLVSTSGDVHDPEAVMARLRSRFMTPVRQSQRDAAVTAQGRLQDADRALKLIVREFGSVLTVSQTNARTTPMGASSEFFLSDPINHLKRYDLRVSAEAVGNEQILVFVDGSGTTFETRVQLGFGMSEEQLAKLRLFLLLGIDRATSDDRFNEPRELEPSAYHPATHLGPFNKLFEEEATFEFRPALKIAWFPPRLSDGALSLAWELTNIGSGTASNVCVFLPNVASYREKDMPVGAVRRAERRYDRIAAYHEFTNFANVIVGYTDIRGNVYRQDGDVKAFPAYGGSEPDYLTTQLGYPFLVTSHGIEPDENGADRFRQTAPWKRLIGDES